MPVRMILISAAFVTVVSTAFGQAPYSTSGAVFEALTSEELDAKAISVEGFWADGHAFTLEAGGSALMGARTNGGASDHEFHASTDTLSFRTFVPLEDGNKWEYGLLPHLSVAYDRFREFEVVGDTLVDEVEYFKVTSRWYDSDFTASSRSIHLLRYDSAGVVVERREGEEKPWLLAALRANPDPKFYYEREEIAVVEDTTMEIAEVPVDVATYRSTLFVGDYSSHESRAHASDVGPLFYSTCSLQCSGGGPSVLELVYAEVGDSTYGRSFVATDMERPGRRRTRPEKLFAYPNPSSGIVNVELASPPARDVSIHIFDALGREVSVFAPVMGLEDAITRQLDLSHLPPGTYFLRVEGMRQMSMSTSIVLVP